ncbi:glycosyltransferase [Candidatus Bathyarchaeota archaeon]|nr:glycosyltransferase [Candidatus Bathyarchaeota archaeon]
MAFRIASLSRLSVERGIQELVKAMPLIRNNVECYIGGNSNENYKNKLIKLSRACGSEEKIHFVGTVFSPKNFLQDKILVVNPILIKTGEEYGASDLEVLINKKALIRSWDKTEHVLKHRYNVYHVNPIPEEIATAVDYLIENPLLRMELEENGYLTAKKILETSIKRHYNVYKSILDLC